MRSLQEWMKYLEEQEQTVKEPEPKAAPEPTQSAPAYEEPKVEVTEPVRPVEPVRPQPVTPPAPKPEPPKVQAPVQPKPAVQQPAKPAPAKPAQPAAVKPVQPAAPRKAELTPAEPKARKPRTPKAVMQNAARDETAQSSYQPFKETREELLQRLLDPVISLEEAARILNVCPTTVRRYTNRGLLPHIRTAGNQRRFRLSDVLAFMGQDPE